MKSKLILTIEDKVIVSAKKYAHKNRKRLSHFVEKYLKSLSVREIDECSIHPKVLKLMGVITLPDNFDYKRELSNTIVTKYKKSESPKDRKRH